jgi:hypothetical protein
MPGARVGNARRDAVVVVTEVVRMSETVVLHLFGHGVEVVGVERVEDHDARQRDADFPTDARGGVGLSRDRGELE